MRFSETSMDAGSMELRKIGECRRPTIWRPRNARLAIQKLSLSVLWLVMPLRTSFGG